MFCVVVHIWPLYSDSVKARLFSMAWYWSVDSMMTLLTPAISAYRRAWRALSCSQRPNWLLPVKSMLATAGLLARAWVWAGSLDSARVTRLGSKPCSLSTSRTMLTVMAAGSTALGWGLTMTGLPVARAANRPG